jgi:phage shock protein A
MQTPENTSSERRFDDVDAAIAEQRQYTEWAYSKLDVKVDALAEKVTTGFARVDDRLAGVDDRLAGVDDRLARVDAQIARIERKLDLLIDRR